MDRIDRRVKKRNVDSRRKTCQRVVEFFWLNLTKFNFKYMPVGIFNLINNNVHVYFTLSLGYLTSKSHKRWQFYRNYKEARCWIFGRSTASRENFDAVRL